MCNCIELTNAELKSHNLELDVPLYGHIIISTHKLDPSKEGQAGLVPTYCPFCGVKIDERKDTK